MYFKCEIVTLNIRIFGNNFKYTFLNNEQKKNQNAILSIPSCNSIKFQSFVNTHREIQIKLNKKALSSIHHKRFVYKKSKFFKLVPFDENFFLFSF